jgi:hypothetical protein
MFCHDFVLGVGGAMMAMFTLSLVAQVSCAVGSCYSQEGQYQQIGC